MRSALIPLFRLTPMQPAETGMLEALNIIAILLSGGVLVAYWRTIDSLKKTDEAVADRLTQQEINMATMVEWRKGHEERHVELVQEIRELKQTLLTAIEKHNASH